MTWQDVVIAVGQFVFIVALVPAIRAKEKPPRTTSVPTAVVLCVFATTFGTLDLWLSSFTSLLSAVAWTVLAWQARLNGGKA